MRYGLTFLLLLLVTIILISNKADTVANLPGYDFSRPDGRLLLPPVLHEISGIALIDSSTMACVQDEKGIIYIYDLHSTKIKREIHFGTDGDYEGLCKVNNTFYVLQSDGILFEVNQIAGRPLQVKKHLTDLPANNSEGLCYDSKNKRLLIGVKGKPGKGAQWKDQRLIYAFDLQKKQLSAQPVYTFNLEQIKQFALKHRIQLPLKEKKNGELPVVKLMTSAIGIHPLNDHLYLLSATEHLLYIFNRTGELQHIETLRASLFNKAEGITFYANGDVLISNEGQELRPTLLRFNYLKK